jgi:hypothetical protein
VLTQHIKSETTTESAVFVSTARKRSLNQSEAIDAIAVAQGDSIFRVVFDADGQGQESFPGNVRLCVGENPPETLSTTANTLR